MSNVQILEKPVLLKAGMTGFVKLKGMPLVITVTSDDGVTVSYTYPLKQNDKTVYSVPKTDIFVSLSDLADMAVN